ncbi:MAG TPA: class F sortase [Tepidiformaceae bacterium]|nr:class F sortase [Tepidiformaceae bacterium]
MSVAGAGLVAAQAPAQQELPYRAFAPGVARGVDPPSPTSTPRPVPYNGPVESMYLGSAGISAAWPIELRDTHVVGGREVFQDPTAPQYIAWYRRFGQPGFVSNNSLFAAHINYVGFGSGPFARLTSASPGDALYLRMENGTELTYTVRTVKVIPLGSLNMEEVVFPNLAPNVERVTLISCGGTFVPRPGGGGDYDSRVILVAERVLD